MLEAVITPLGDAALNVRTTLARELLADLNARPLPGVLEGIPALNLLTVLFNPMRVSENELEAALRARLQALHPQTAAEERHLIIPVTFDGIDLPWCAEHAGLSEPEFIDAVCHAPLEVAFLGFTPGFAFLTGLPERLQMPRLSAPRERLPAGSVALGGPWAGVYPRETPGGWRLIGHTQTQLFDPNREEIVLWRAGDRISFQAVSG